MRFETKTRENFFNIRFSNTEYLLLGKLALYEHLKFSEMIRVLLREGAEKRGILPGSSIEIPMHNEVQNEP